MHIKLNQIVKQIIVIIIAGMISLFLLGFLVLIYSYTGTHIHSQTGATDYTWEPNQIMSTMNEGFAWLRMDQNGFNNAFPVKDRNVDILLMGSSHMEALEVGKDENTGYLLNVLLPDKYTYNIGISGHTIYTCIDNIKAAVNEYDPSDYVIIETSTIDMDIESMQLVINNEYGEIPSYDKGLLYMAQKYIPSVKLIYKKLIEWKNADDETDYTTEISEAKTSPSSNYKETLWKFLEVAASSTIAKQRHLIIFYHPTLTINQDGNIVDITNQTNKSLFASYCEQQGIIFIDMTDDFITLYNDRHVMADGFVNTGVGVGHLNKYGHEIIAIRLANVIKEKDEWH